MIQIDIKMPKCCDECFALDDYGDYPFCLISQDQRGYTFNTKEKRMPTCPLKAQEPIEARLHLCDSCKKQYPECDATKDGVAFGSGTGNDNIVGCTAYVNRWKAQEPTSTPEAEWLLYKGTKGATCSYCKHTYYDVYDVENYDYYCRHCGAKMIRIRTVKWE